VGDLLVDELPDFRRRPDGAPSALAGVRVLDFSQFVAGPLAAAILADLGADVIKIEKPGGEDMRGGAGMELRIADGTGGGFLWANHNKRSVTIDLATDAGARVARDLATGADVVIENFSAGVMQRYGLDYESVSAGNPRLIYCSISAAGRDGSFSDRLAFDPITQAESGFVQLNTPPVAPQRSLHTPIADMTTGMSASTAILAALCARERLGRGQRVELAMFDQGVNLLAYHAGHLAFSGEHSPAPQGPVAAPAGLFATADGCIYVSCANDRTFQRFMQALGLTREAEDPRFRDMASRYANADVFIPILADALSVQTTDHWLRLLREHRVPVGPVRTVREAIASPEVRERRLVSRLRHASGAFVPHIASPLRLDHTPICDPVAAPELGAHTREVVA
jgi:crotonobetainyl-CoA:carnitine CoA-transferase CaiB-like acyl-CoA transferase